MSWGETLMSLTDVAKEMIIVDIEGGRHFTVTWQC